MDRNFTDGDGTNGTIPETVAWCTDGESDNATCKNINTTGSNAPTGKDYIGHIIETFNTSGVTVSFPSEDQIEGAYSGTMPTWLYDYLDGKTHSVSGIYGYWTSCAGNNSFIARILSYNGSVSSTHVIYGSGIGLRPVITILKSKLN